MEGFNKGMRVSHAPQRKEMQLSPRTRKTSDNMTATLSGFLWSRLPWCLVPASLGGSAGQFSASGQTWQRITTPWYHNESKLKD